ncbi:NAD-dependent DNA ligase LigA [Anaerocaecibacter muris]|uniref:NAD-dependent DNA ligase LigA n=1 Tax=Anaerocaecibacter muris TaxID=2941513 RepID=UPI00203EA920|nr:NAD-dependent DNA ligase LigA [Anaerocaecibacter muris]
MSGNDRMTELVKKLNELAYRYYVLDEPTVSDKEYDALYDELVRLEAQSGVVLADSPTKRVGGEPLKQFTPHTHIRRLYSLDKCNSFDELRAWFDKLKTALGYAPACTLEYKLDGLTICLTYRDGELVTGATRGNGEVGETVTEQVKTIKSVPLGISFKGEAEIQGEGIMRISALEKYNATAAVPLKNPRNAVAGAIRNLDAKETAKRNLDVFFYNVNYMDGDVKLSQTEQIEFLKDNRFKTGICFVSDDIEAIIAKIQEVDRASLDFAIDGMVIKVNDPAARVAIGYTDKFPKWAIAYKFEAEETTTLLKDVAWQVGRTGKLTPLALLEPVELCGATVKRATLNNYGDICRKDVTIGSRVFVRRSNDVIPEILGVAETGDNAQKIEKPTTCPCCGYELTEDGANLFCQNFYGCRSQVVARVVHFCAKDCMDIDGVSIKTAEQLYDILGVRSAASLYDLTADDLKKIDGFKDKKIANFLAAVQKSKSASLAQLINALCIDNVGRVIARTLAEHFGSIDGLIAATEEELIAIPDVGGIVAQSIIDYFARHADVVERYKQLGINPVHKKQTGGKFDGVKFVLTGTLSEFSRDEARRLIEAEGGIVQSAVSKQTDIVVAGESAGSKLKKAEALGKKIIDETQFKNMLNT